jgi:putative addiction module component (TIGR02574 family)
MARTKEVLKRELMELDPADRAEVAEEALRSLADTSYGELSPAWEKELERRAKSLDDGSAELIPGEDVFKEIEAELRARRGRR